MNAKIVEKKLAQAQAMLDKSEAEYVKCLEEHASGNKEARKDIARLREEWNMCLEHWGQWLREAVTSDCSKFINCAHLIEINYMNECDHLDELHKQKSRLYNELENADYMGYDQTKIRQKLKEKALEIDKFEIVSSRNDVLRQAVFERKVLDYPAHCAERIEIEEAELRFGSILWQKDQKMPEWERRNWLLHLNRALLVYQAATRGQTVDLKTISDQIVDNKYTTWGERPHMSKPVIEAVQILKKAQREFASPRSIRMQEKGEGDSKARA